MTEHDREIWFLEEMLAILCQYLSKFSFIKKKRTHSLSQALTFMKLPEHIVFSNFCLYF